MDFTERTHEPTSTRWILAGIVGLSLVMHLWGIKQNLPYTPEVDEAIYVGRAVRMAASGDLNPHWFGNPGSTVIYPLAAIFHVWHAVTQRGMFFRADPDLDIRFRQSSWEFYLIGRLLSIAYGVMTVPVVYLIGHRAFGARVGLAGAWFFAFYPIAIWHAKMARTVSVAVFFGMLSLYLCLRAYDRPTKVNQLLAGLSIGLGIASRYYNAALVPILLLVDGMVLRRLPAEADKKRVWTYMGLGVLSIGVAFVLSTPYFFLDLDEAFRSLRYEARSSHLGSDGLSPAGNLLWYVTEAIPDGMTWPQAILALIGAILVVSKRELRQILISAYVVIFLGGVCLSALHESRWTLQTLPVLALFAAHGLDIIITRLSTSAKLRLVVHSGVFVLGVLAASAWPIYQVVSLDIQQANPSTRILARRWIMDNLPGGSRIAQESHTAPLADSTIAVSNRFSLAEGRALDDYSAMGYQYLVVSSYVYRRYFAEPDRYPAEVNFYRSLFERGKLLQEFEPSRTRGGPTIKIYALEAG